MATFAEYQQQTIASNDFTLYPYQESWDQDQPYPPTTTYADPSYLNTTTFAPFQTTPAFLNPVQDQFDFDFQPFKQTKTGLQAPPSTYSPANSASHSTDFRNPPVFSSTSDSGASVQSTISSAMASPTLHSQPSNDWQQVQQGMNMLPDILHDDSFSQDVFTTAFDFEPIPVTDKGCVDPALIQPFSPTPYTGAQFPDVLAASPQPIAFPQPQSPMPMRQTSIGKAPSPHMRSHTWQPYPVDARSRGQSVSSVHSRHSQGSLSSDDSNKGFCPIPTCGRHVKDLKAHMLTHQNERPEKCPIPTCEYHTKGFARKYDKNRHTLTHYKGTMVCGFCPGSGSAAEKSFNRADVFKRHLTSVHGVEQTPPNARRKSPSTSSSKRSFSGRDVSGMCSTCGITFASAQDFYEHLDDCVLRVVQQADPREAINEKLLLSMTDDRQVQETMEKHSLPAAMDFDGPTTFDGEDEGEDHEITKVEDDGTDGVFHFDQPATGASKSRKAGNSS